MAPRLASPAGAAPAPRILPPHRGRAKRALAGTDPIMAGLIAAHPRVRMVSRGDGFSTLVRSIVGQQISVKAADSVWARLCERCPQITPEALLRRRAATLRSCGLSGRKVEYLQDLARHFDAGRVRMEDLAGLADEEVIEILTEIRGIGRWTAEMFLIFNLLRPDVFPVDDLGLLKAVGLHYFDGTPCAELLRGAGRQKVLQLGAAWAPYRSVATWYLWRSLDPVPVEY
jgi:DNA-3-methyladenine glycosylase II